MTTPDNTGIPSPQSAELVQVIRLRWEFIRGSEVIERLEFWDRGSCQASRERSIGVTGSTGPDDSALGKQRF